MSSMKGFSNSQINRVYGGKQEHATFQKMQDGRVGLDMIQRAVFDVETLPATAILKNVITIPGTAAKPGDLIQHVTSGDEFVVGSVSGDDISVFVDIPTAYATDDFDLKRYVTFKVDKDGSTVVTVAPAPVSFNLDSVATEVSEDTVDPANNIPLPSKMFIQKDGVHTPINKDTGTASNTVAMPVEIVGTAGTEINITAGDINVQTTHLGANADSMRIGDGVNELQINASLQAETHDQDVLDAFTAGQLARAASLGITLSTEDQATQDAILAAFTAGQAASAASAPVSLSTEQEAILQAISDSSSANIGSLYSAALNTVSAGGDTLYTAVIPVKKVQLQNQASDILRLEIGGSVVGHVLQGGEINIDVAGLTGPVVIFGENGAATGNFAVNILG